MPKVDLDHYKGREQAYVKHYLLEKYLPDWAYKVGSKWDSLAYVDPFAGPWQTTDPDFADSSFGVAVSVLRKCQAGLRDKGRVLKIDCILVDQDRDAFKQLQRFAAENTHAGFKVHALGGQFVKQIPAIDRIIEENTSNPFRFIFLDPKGWADIPMRKLQPFLRRRSCEVLISLMTRHIIRFLDEPDRADSYRNLFGREEVLKILRNLRSAPPQVRAERAVREYGKSLKLLCDFKYVSSAVILEPDEEAIRYFLVYATNHQRGIEVFKEAEKRAAQIQDTVRHETHLHKTQQPTLAFDDKPPTSRYSLQLREFFSEMARRQVIRMLLENASDSTEIRYSDLYCEAMTFPLISPDDLVAWLKIMEPNVKVVLSGSQRRKKPSPAEDDRVVVN